MIVDFVLSIHTPVFSEDLKVKNMGKQKLYHGICKLVQIWVEPRGNRQNLFVYMR